MWKLSINDFDCRIILFLSSTVQLTSFSCRQYATDNANTVIEDSATIAGDPLQHDIITMFGNDGAHWYSILIDNRPNIKEVMSSKIYFFTLSLLYRR